MAYTLLDAAYQMYYPEAEFAFGRKTRRNKRMKGRLLGRTGGGRAARIGGLLAAGGLAAGAARYGGQALRVGKAAYKSKGLVGAAQQAAGSVGRGVQGDLATANRAIGNARVAGTRNAKNAGARAKKMLWGG